jgi:protein-arginine kinase activator protein McsA
LGLAAASTRQGKSAAINARQPASSAPEDIGRASAEPGGESGDETVAGARRPNRTRQTIGPTMTPSFTCPSCGRVSYNLNDIRERYCGACHQWFDSVAIARLIEEVRNGNAETNGYNRVYNRHNRS